MKRIFGAIAVFVLGVAFFAAPTASAQGTNNFTILTFDIQYELSRDSEGRSVLKTTETITAKFHPYLNQNHGLERAIPHTYDGHSVSLNILDVKNLTNGSSEYSTSTRGDMTTLRIGNADTYVHGEQQYRIVYTQRDVTKNFSNTQRDEWYWDTNGTEWRVPIEKLTVSVSMTGELAKALSSDVHCYQGAFSATDRCELTKTSEATYALVAENLKSGENATVAFGFTSGTFAGYKASLWDILKAAWVIIQFASIPVVFVVLTLLTVLYYRRTYRSSEMHTIVTEYIPPKDASVLVASSIAGSPLYAFSAQLIDLAVRRYIAIIETKEKSTWKAAEYDIVIQKDPNLLLAEEQEILSDMFDGLPKEGGRLALKSLQTNYKYSARTMDNDKKLKVLVEGVYQLRHKNADASKVLKVWAILLTIVGVLTLSIPLLFVTVFAWSYASVIRPLTDKGLELRRYVKGLDKYIKASETQRLAFLQGPDTAEKVGFAVNTEDPGQLVKLYERVLPYAILFGHEKDWSKRLGEFYQQTNQSPDWYSGNTVFNAAVFSAAMSSFTQSASYSGGASSSSGGSSGGGSSGGGGGGGGGGGW
ncbi:MAG: DUF2207 domain-containing protein [Candidatus Microsaccharimonas sp.]